MPRARSTCLYNAVQGSSRDLTKEEESPDIRPPACRYSRSRVLGTLAAVEGRSSHPLAVAVVRAAKAEGVRIPAGDTVECFSTLAAEGVTALVEGQPVHIGNARLARRLLAPTQLQCADFQVC